MKKVLFVLVAIAMVFSLAACAGTEAVMEDLTTPSVSEEVTSVEPQSEPAVDFAELVPDPKEIFTDGTVTLTVTDNMYFASVKDYTVEEYETYIAQCEQMGFTKVKYAVENDGGRMFGAYTSDDKYWVEVFLGETNKAVTISCRESKKNK